MKVYRAERIRNVALISHVGAGKTSLVDAALFDSGAVTRQGKVDEGSSISDYDPDELKRRMSLNVKVLPVEWKDTKINFIDTPGYADFIGEVKAGLRVADAALVVVTAEKGVEVGTELTWHYADERNLPRIVLVNKLDRENTSFDQALESLRAQFGSRVVPLQVPIGEQTNFKGVVDLVTQKGYTFEGGNKVQEILLPTDIAGSHQRIPRPAHRSSGRERRRYSGKVPGRRGIERRGDPFGRQKGHLHRATYSCTLRLSNQKYRRTNAPGYYRRLPAQPCRCHCRGCASLRRYPLALRLQNGCSSGRHPLHIPHL